MSTDHQFFEDFARRWVDAWNSGSTDRVLELLHPDITWDERVFWPEVLHGREAVRVYVEAVWRAMPGYRMEERQLFTAPTEGRALVFFRQTGRGPAGLGENRSFETQGCDIFLGFTDGLLSDYTATFDIVDMLRQLEALPPRGQLKGGAYLMSLPRRAEPVGARGARGGEPTP
ncbi:nuclear transport factor 2 family protein [uncultured Jatrophihabitans sp.]|uniref:nuclear transport factor 2 family protein n=1 Tax=uncultured Jatrophihabitans sp. TaxID=1610747 RepID=UPI0035CAAB35